MRVTIIADASYCPDYKVGGYGYWIACERGKHGGSGIFRGEITTNITAEMMALCNALHEALSRGLVLPYDKVLMQTDCIPAIDAFIGSRYNLNEQEVKAAAVLHDLEDRNFLLIDFRHVKGHTLRDGARYVTNRRCDQKAKDAMRKARMTKVCQTYGEEQ